MPPSTEANNRALFTHLLQSHNAKSLELASNETVSPVQNTTHAEFVQMYYEHQYKRMAQLENQRLTISNIVTTISIFGLNFGFGELHMTTYNGVLLAAAMATTNIAIFLYILSSSHWYRVTSTMGKEGASTVFSLE